MPRVIGLTGGIASGKSAVSRILRERGLPVIDADTIAHEILATNEEVKQKVVTAFGPEVLTAAGAVDRARLGTIIFRDAQRRRDLERILHPMIAAALWQRAQEGDDVVVLEIPLLIEQGEHERVDLVVVVYATRESQIQRLMERDGLTREEAMRRIKTQRALEEKVAYAHYVINNNGSPEETEEQVSRLYQAVRGK
ncbi:MAG: dephospho-CoA kinase [Deltaproteobacteria bacterium RBG_16_54_18]|jgi:dephospho-CoA kinase|nr:MAG: dephospho-CoA kinase [Deltaproteobacteria bacterium RBG_16_54_18]